MTRPTVTALKKTNDGGHHRAVDVAEGAAPARGVEVDAVEAELGPPFVGGAVHHEAGGERRDRIGTRLCGLLGVHGHAPVVVRRPDPSGRGPHAVRASARYQRRHHYPRRGEGPHRVRHRDDGDVGRRARRRRGRRSNRSGSTRMWWSDVLTVPGDDPLAAMAYAAGCGVRLKDRHHHGAAGPQPGAAGQAARHARPVVGRTAARHLRAWACACPPSSSAWAWPPATATGSSTKLLPLLRRLWTEDAVDHDGERWRFTPSPWSPSHSSSRSTCGSAVSARARCAGPGASPTGGCRRCARRRRPPPVDASVEEAAADAGRHIDPEHFGVSIGYTRHGAPAQLLERVVARRARAPRAAGTARRTGRAPPTSIGVISSPTGSTGCAGWWSASSTSGFSKFVMRPIAPPASFRDELHWLGDGVLDLQS